MKPSCVDSKLASAPAIAHPAVRPTLSLRIFPMTAPRLLRRQLLLGAAASLLQTSAASWAQLLKSTGQPRSLEIAQFAMGLEKRNRQRYVVGLAEVNLQTMMPMGLFRHTPVMATQVAPMLTADDRIVG